MNSWKKIWESRCSRLDCIDISDQRSVFLELKRIDGFDVNKDGLSYEALYDQHRHIMDMLSKKQTISRIFDVGCGSGANLFLSYTHGLAIGGLDYSAQQINTMKYLFERYNYTPLEAICDEAMHLPTSVKYDAVIANSVFSYFPNYEYAKIVLQAMIDKATYGIAIIDIHDSETKDDYISCRKKMIDDYNERYKGLEKCFYDKSLFQEVANNNHCEILFEKYAVEGYWNNDYVYNCFIYRPHHHLHH